MKNILLIGILGVYNYGCEAIVRGTVEILRKINPDIKISYASFDYENDFRKLRDLNINIIKRPNKFKRWTFANVVWKISSILRLPFNRPYDSTNWISGFDTIFSIGGDMYTLGANGSYKTDLPLFFEKCQNKGLKYILWGASVGPFDKTPAALEFYKKHLSKTDLIVAREYATIKYLKSIGISDNVIYAPDPAYFVSDKYNDQKKEYPSRTSRKIGINLSPLSAVHYYSDIQTAVKLQSKTITDLIREYDYEVVLVPHVVSPRHWEDDLAYMNQIYDMIPYDYKNKISIVSENPGFVGLKETLHTLDFMIAARMHCAINSICCGVPVLFLSYSSKAKGMADLIYGNSNRVVPLDTFENSDAIHKFIEYRDCDSRLNEIVSFDFNNIIGCE